MITFSKVYTEKVLVRFDMVKTKLVFMPLVKHFILSVEQCPKSVEEIRDIAQVPYASTVGCLMYATVCTK